MFAGLLEAREICMQRSRALQKFGPNFVILDGFVTAVSSRRDVLPIKFAGQVSCAQHEESEGKGTLMAAFSFLVFFDG